MATYKVLQDIEAEDKILGPLTLKQFIFAIITFAIGFINFKIVTTPGLSVTRWPLAILFLIPMLLFGFLAAPIGRDQPNDVWLLARVRYLVKPHQRVWNQDGVNQLVTITAPKKIEQVRTNGLNQYEVESRLKALANTLDSRGWAIKNVDINMFANPDYFNNAGSDRLVALSPSTTSPVTDVHAADDILDTDSNPTAHNLDLMIQESTVTHKKRVLDSLKSPAPVTEPADYWFMNQPNPSTNTVQTVPTGYTTFQSSSVITPGSLDNNSAVPTADEKAFISKLEDQNITTPMYKNPHIKTIQPLGAQNVDTGAQQLNQPTNSNFDENTQKAQAAGGTNTSNPVILNLASNDDLNVATIARQANRISEDDGEVVVSLR